MGNRTGRLECLHIDLTPGRQDLASLALGLGLADLQSDGAFSWSRSNGRNVLTGVSREDLAAACQRMEQQFNTWSIQLSEAALPDLAAYAFGLAQESMWIRCQTVLNETQSHLAVMTQSVQTAVGRSSAGLA